MRAKFIHIKVKAGLQLQRINAVKDCPTSTGGAHCIMCHEGMYVDNSLVYIVNVW